MEDAIKGSSKKYNDSLSARVNVFKGNDYDKRQEFQCLKAASVFRKTFIKEQYNMQPIRMTRLGSN